MKNLKRPFEESNPLMKRTKVLETNVNTKEGIQDIFQKV